MSIKIILFSVFFVLLSEKQRFLLLKVTTFIIPVVHSTFYQSSMELHVRGFQHFSPFMVIVAEFLALTLLLKVLFETRNFQNMW